MHELLEPSAENTESLRVCERYLRRRLGRWRHVRLLLSRTDRTRFVTLMAWHRLVDELTRTASELVLRRALDALEGELAAVERRAAVTPIGRLLDPLIHRHGLELELLRRPLREARRLVDVHAFSTRGELQGCLRELALPEGRLWVQAFLAPSERAFAQADALATGIRLVRWLEELAPDFARGRLFLPVDELAEHGVAWTGLAARAATSAAAPFDTPGFRAAVASQARWAARELAKGWPLCAESGPWRGRLLAFTLRWQAAALAALAARDQDVSRGSTPAGWTRFAACALATAVLPRDQSSWPT